MQNRSVVNRHAARFLITCTILVAVTFSMLAPSVAAEDTASYTATEIHDWLVDQISNATVDLTNATVSLNSEFDYVDVSGVSLDLMGISVGLSPLRLNLQDQDDPPSTEVGVTATFDVFNIDPEPRIQCVATASCVGPGGALEVSDISEVSIGSFVPTFSAEDISTIVDVVNQAIVASELTVSPPEATLTGISVVADGGTDKVRLTWSDDSQTLLEASYIQTKLNGMIGTLETKATNCLQEGEGDWNIEVDVVSDTSLDIAASLTAFGITATLDVPIAFSTLAATISNANLSVGSKSVTFSAAGEIGCSGGVPSVAMASLTLGDEYPGLQQFIIDIQDALLDAIDQAVDDIVADTGLTFPFSSISAITIEEETVVLHAADEVTVDLVLKTGWNMVSVPVVPDNTATSSVFAGSVAVYTWNPVNKSYVVPINVDPSEGYWVAVTTDRTISVTGTPVSQWECGLVTGWSMVGSVQPRAVPIGEIVDVPADSIIRSAIYGWNAISKSYIPAVALDIGHGYWMASTANCDITVS